jgi:hypothetical protein
MSFANDIMDSVPEAQPTNQREKSLAQSLHRDPTAAGIVETIDQVLHEAH